MASANAVTRPLVRLWKDTVRVQQLARLDSLQRQACDKEAIEVLEQCKELKKTFPKGMRFDLPSVHVFSALLGVIRTSVSIKQNPMNELELSAQDFADKIHYDKSTTENALRWLSEDEIKFKGKVIANGLGIIERSRRKACAFVNGVKKQIYRTTKTALTAIGRVLLRLALIVVKQPVVTKPKAPQIVLTPLSVVSSPEEVARAAKEFFSLVKDF